jgi:hypothetical protein
VFEFKNDNNEISLKLYILHYFLKLYLSLKHASGRKYSNGDEKRKLKAGSGKGDE